MLVHLILGIASKINENYEIILNINCGNSIVFIRAQLVASLITPGHLLSVDVVPIGKY